MYVASCCVHFFRWAPSLHQSIKKEISILTCSLAKATEGPGVYMRTEKSCVTGNRVFLLVAKRNNESKLTRRGTDEDHRGMASTTVKKSLPAIDTWWSLAIHHALANPQKGHKTSCPFSFRKKWDLLELMETVRDRVPNGEEERGSFCRGNSDGH